jgi:hypothetical protein
MGVVATEPSDQPWDVLPTIAEWEEREGGDGATCCEHEDASDIYVEGILRGGVEGVQRSGCD